MAKKGKRRRTRRNRTGNYRKRPFDRQDVLPRFLIVCEGKKTEPYYFRGFRVPKDVAEIDVKGLGKTPLQLVEKALRLRSKAAVKLDLNEYDQVWCVFDKDDWEDDKFNDLIEEAKNEGLDIAYSNQAFELWFLLHFHYYDYPMHRSQYEGELSKLLGRRYKKNSPDMYYRLYSKQKTAINNAEQLLELYVPRNPAKDNPSTTVHRLVKELNRFLPENRRDTA